MKLYFAPMTCSLSPHIVLRELGLPFELIRVNNKTKRTGDGQDFRDINPKGYVAALVLDDGEVLTEGAALLQYLTSLPLTNPMAPASGTWEHARFNEWLAFIATEVHSTSALLFNDEFPEAVKTIIRERYFKRLNYVNDTLQTRDFLMGPFGAADAYLFAVLKWLPFFNIDIRQWPQLEGFMVRVESRAAVQAAIAAEEATAAV